MSYYIYILANETNVTIYTGMTNDIIWRVYEHRTHADPYSFTAGYNVTKLVYFEKSDTAITAIEREKQIKSWSRKKKNQLVETLNPEWHDLYTALF